MLILNIFLSVRSIITCFIEFHIHKQHKCQRLNSAFQFDGVYRSILNTGGRETSQIVTILNPLFNILGKGVY
jgi:hypothetical protein